MCESNVAKKWETLEHLEKCGSGALNGSDAYKPQSHPFIFFHEPKPHLFTYRN